MRFCDFVEVCTVSSPLPVTPELSRTIYLVETFEIYVYKLRKDYVLKRIEYLSFEISKIDMRGARGGGFKNVLCLVFGGFVPRSRRIKHTKVAKIMRTKNTSNHVYIICTYFLPPSLSFL